MGAGARITLNNILYLTDFSQPSEAALPFAVGIARNYGATVRALYVLPASSYAYTPPELRAAADGLDERLAQTGMHEVDSQLSGVAHTTIIARGGGIWPTIEQAIKDYDVDLIVLGTHGRSGVQKLLLGSVAEEIVRRSPVPVLTIGPKVCGTANKDARFRHVLFATDFESESRVAAPFAISFAEDNQADLLLLHVLWDEQSKEERLGEGRVAEAVRELHAMIPKDWDLRCRPEAVVEYGEPSRRIVEVAKQRGVDLIVLGAREAQGHIAEATHLERTTAHRVLIHADCPVLSVTNWESHRKIAESASA